MPLQTRLFFFGDISYYVPDLRSHIGFENGLPSFYSGSSEVAYEFVGPPPLGSGSPRPNCCNRTDYLIIHGHRKMVSINDPALWSSGTFARSKVASTNWRTTSEGIRDFIFSVSYKLKSRFGIQSFLLFSYVCAIEYSR